ncbi:MAG: DinB family protein [Ignavibacteria bacterium]|nr:DinB family protein [Ignavibacteria bacterium]
MTNEKTQTLIKAYQMARNLSNYYISKMESIDIHKVYEVNGVKMNSAYWILAHLVWTEHFLVIEGIGGESLGIEWLNDYGFGSVPDEIKNQPSIEEVRKRFEEVHTKAMDILNSMTDELMEAENNIEANFGGSKDKFHVLMHAIRHEPMHIGQLSWILKINGIKLT